MASTLIVRDATLAINGAPETRPEPPEFLRERILEAANLSEETIQDCVEVLLASASGEDPEAEVLEALTILGLSQPRIAAELGVSAVSHGRRLSSRLERDGDVAHAIAVLELLAENHPGHRSLERDLAAMMRRTGMVTDLVERYILRAQGLLKEGRTAEAIAWYREVLLLDRSRKDVARTIRDLRFQEVDDGRNRKRRRRLTVLVLAVSAVISMVALREVQVRQAFTELPAAVSGDLPSMRARLAGLEAFVSDHPIWHGGLGVVAERAALRVEIETLAQERAFEEEARRDAEASRLEAINLARARGRAHVHSGDYAAALRELENALRLAGPDWSERDRVERDVAAVREFLQEQERQE